MGHTAGIVKWMQTNHAIREEHGEAHAGSGEILQRFLAASIQDHAQRIS
jgi:hypothetical protein